MQCDFRVSTHSRLKAAGAAVLLLHLQEQRFNTQPPEGGWVGMISLRVGASVVSTHSRLKAAGGQEYTPYPISAVSTHSRLKAAGHTVKIQVIYGRVSTHSRLKAAGSGS